MGIFSRKVIVTGSMSVDPAEIRRWEEYAAVSGKPVHIPGGAAGTSYVVDQLKKADKEAVAFRNRISDEYDAMKKSKTEKPDKKIAEKRARAWMKQKFGWKK